MPGSHSTISGQKTITTTSSISAITYGHMPLSVS